MSNILRKEIKLSASFLSFAFLAFGLMFFLPGYPILCGAFFISLGLFQSFKNAREAGDIVFSALLPIAKRDVVKGKYIFCVFIELIGLFIMLIVTLVRMTLLSAAAPYTQNAMMNANFFALGVAFLIFGLFNCIFIRGFFKTAYKFAKPFILFIAACFVTIMVAEALHHIPGFGVLNAFGFDHIGFQVLLLLAGIVIYIVLTLVSCKQAGNSFERIDL